MASPKNFVTGFNHNVKHAGHALHVQTEDSGEEIAAISTHLFLGGTIVASRRSAYDDLRGTKDLHQAVRTRMEEQHKQMLRDLVHGAFDDKLQGLKSFQPGELAVGPASPAAGGRQPARATLEDDGVVRAPDRATVVDDGIRIVPRRRPRHAEGRVALLDTSLLVEEVPFGRATVLDDGVVGSRNFTPPPPAPGRQQRPAVRPPPPPPDALRNRPALSHLEPDAPFGGDVITDRSLDEVILAFLAGESED